MLPSDYQGLLGCAVRLMTEDESGDMLRCLIMEKGMLTLEGEALMREEAKMAAEAGFGWNVLTKRLNAFGVKSTIAVRLYILTLCENPAQAVLWAFTMAKMAEKNKFQQVTMEQLAESFPDGVPVDEEYRRLWDLQKCSDRSRGWTDNWLDYAEVWPKQPAEAV